MKKGEEGFTLVEMIIAVAIVGIIAVAFLAALGTIYKSDIIASQLTNAESLARSQIEYVKSQSYSPNSWQYTVSSSSIVSINKPSWWGVDNPSLLSSEYSGFSVTVDALDFDSDGDGIVEVPGEDQRVRKIVAAVYHDGSSEPVLVLEDYKVNVKR